MSKMFHQIQELVQNADYPIVISIATTDDVITVGSNSFKNMPIKNQNLTILTMIHSQTRAIFGKE